VSEKLIDNDPFDGIDLNTLDGWIKRDSDEKKVSFDFNNLAKKNVSSCFQTKQKGVQSVHNGVV